MRVYNKLVRDKIPEIMVNNGAKPVTKILDNKEYLDELNKKILEEVNEYIESGEVMELADIYEVLLAILDVKNVNYNEFEKMRKSKVIERGAFKDKIFLISEE